MALCAGQLYRPIRTLLSGWADRQVFTTNDERAQALEPWPEHYNTGSRHSALGGLPPISRLSPTQWPGTPGGVGARPLNQRADVHLDPFPVPGSSA